LHTAFNGRIVNFQMWDEILDKYDVAFPSWKSVFVSSGAQTLPHVAALEPTFGDPPQQPVGTGGDEPSDASYDKVGGYLSVEPFRMERFYTDQATEN
jgi:hypothetical protein